MREILLIIVEKKKLVHENIFIIFFICDFIRTLKHSLIAQPTLIQLINTEKMGPDGNNVSIIAFLLKKNCIEMAHGDLSTGSTNITH